MVENIPLISRNASLGRGMAQMLPPGTQAIHGKGKGEGNMEKDGQPWWEGAISILDVTYLCHEEQITGYSIETWLSNNGLKR